jgi:PGF-CTERM protein
MTYRTVFVVVFLVVAGVGPAVVSADTPSVSTRVNGESLSDGQSTVVTQNPDLTVEASASDSIESVVVRINGESARSFSPGETSFSRTFVPQLDDSERNTVKIIVRDSAGGVASIQVTIIKDGVAPFIGFDSPFESKLGSRPPEQVSVSESTLTFSGSFEDISGVKVMSIERRHFYTAVSEERVATSNTQLRDPGSSFETEVFVGYGRNVVDVTLTDNQGNSRSYTIEFDVNDRTAPDVSLDATPSEIRRSSVTLSGTASDNTQIDEVTYSIEGNVDSATLISSEGDGADADRKSMEFKQTVSLTPGENVIQVTARDVSGRTASVRRVVVYNDTVVPEMTIEPISSEQGSVRFDGHVRYGSFTQASVETVDPETDETLDFKQVYDGDATGQNVTFEEQMSAVEDGPTQVVLRVVDSKGDEHVRTVTVQPGEMRDGDTDADDGGGSDAGSGSGDESDAGSDGGDGSDGDGSDGGSDAGSSDGSNGSGGDGESTRTVIPGFGVGHTVAAVVAVALLFVRRRTR